MFAGSNNVEHKDSLLFSHGVYDTMNETPPPTTLSLIRVLMWFRYTVSSLELCDGPAVPFPGRSREKVEASLKLVSNIAAKSLVENEETEGARSLYP